MEKKKIKKKINPKVKLFVWSLFNYLVLLVPLLILVIVKRETYFTSKTTLNNLMGLLLVGVFTIIALGKHSNFLKGCWGGLIIFGAVFFLRYVLDDLVLIVGCFEIGVIISTLFTGKMVNKWKRICDKVETARINANAFGVNNDNDI